MPNSESQHDINFIRGFMGPGRIKNNMYGTANQTNLNSVTQIVDGARTSRAYDYLLNMGFTSLCDAKSIGFFNSANVAAKISHYRRLEEISNEKTIKLASRHKNSHSRFKSSLYDVLERRHSARNFVQHTMGFDEFSEILRLSFGMATRETLYDDVVVSTRHYGSGGGLYPVEVILIVNAVESIAPGVYKYQPYSHSLQPFSCTMDIHQVFEYGSFDLEQYSFAVLYKYDLNRNIEKYGDLALAITFIEVGLMSQNFCLAYTSLGYSGCQIAGYNKHYCEQQLGFDGINSHILFAELCGRE